MLFVPELKIREMLLEAIIELAGDEFRLDEMFGRADTSLDVTTEGTWLLDMREILLDVIGAQGLSRLVGVGYPGQDAHLPYISIVTAGAVEDDSVATMGNVLGRSGEAVGELTATGPSGTLREHVAIGTDWNTNVQIGSWAVAGEMAAVLHSVVKHLMFRHKGRLHTAGVLDVSLSDSGFEPDRQMHPHTAYVPILSVRISHTMVQTRREDPAPFKVTACPGAFGN